MGMSIMDYMRPTKMPLSLEERDTTEQQYGKTFMRISYPTQAFCFIIFITWTNKGPKAPAGKSAGIMSAILLSTFRAS